MDINYLGHSSFKLRGKKASVVTDPFPASIGFSMKNVSADLVTVSHTQHDDHNACDQVSGTARRKQPYVIQAPGEYEVEGVGIFGWSSFHDDSQGSERGKNTIYVIHIDGVRVVHLGDLGHVLTDSLVKNIGEVDVVLVPVGGVYTINPKQAAEVVNQLSPAYVVPMHYKTADHKTDVFGQMEQVAAFLEAMGVDDALEEQERLIVTAGQLPEETEVVVLQRS